MERIHIAATAALAIALLSVFFSDGSSASSGEAGAGSRTAPGLVTFELGAGTKWSGLERAFDLDAGLAEDLATLQVTRVTPYFVRTSRSPVTPQEERLSRIFQAEYRSAMRPESAAALIMRSPVVVAASAMPLRGLCGLPDDPRFREQWGFDQASDVDMDLPEAWDVSTGDGAPVIAILDTGLDRVHPDMGGVSPDSPGNVWVNAAEAAGSPDVDDDANGFVDDVWGWDFVDYVPGEGDPSPWPGEDDVEEDPDPSDFHGHGTAVAGVAGAIGNNGEGVAGLIWNCRIMGLRCGLAVRGGPSPVGVVRMDWCARAVTYAVDMGASAINASWESGYDVGLEAAVDYAISEGVVVVVAAGNRGRDPHPLEERNYLSWRGDCIDVAGIQQDGRRKSDSNFGPWVDISAPGSAILTLKFFPPDFRGYGLWSGTSFAAPAVAAAAALLKSRNPGWSAEQVRAHLQATSTELTPPDTTMGSGLLNAFRAIRSFDGGWSVRLGSSASTAVMPVGAPGGARAIVTGLSDGQAVGLTVEGLPLSSWPVRLGEAPLSGVAAADCGGDDEPEIVFVDSEGKVSVLGLDGLISSSWSAGAPPVGAPVLSDLDGEGPAEILLACADGTLHAWTAEGTPLSGWPVTLGAFPAGAAASGDLDGLAGAEAVVACVDGTVHCLSGDGLELPGWPVASGASIGSAPTLADVAGEDGLPEVVVGAADGRLLAWDASGGMPEGWPVEAGEAPAEGGLSVSDTDGDGVDEIVWATGGGKILVYDSRGSEEAVWSASTPSTGSPALIADVTGDSIPEILAGVEGVGVGAWTGSGSKVANWPKPTRGAPSTAVAVGDFDGDGRPEVLASSAEGWLHCWDLEGVRYAHAAAPWPLPSRTRGNTRLAPLRLPADVPVGGQGLGEASPFRVVALRAAPNPMSGTTTITSELAGRADTRRRVRIRIYDAAGRLVKRIATPLRAPGVYRDRWSGGTDAGRPAPSGVYFCVVDVDDSALSCPLILLR